jgi:RHS repeat-associated protein
LSGRSFSSPSYKYGFNGMEKDAEMYGSDGSSYDFGARMNHPSLARWLSIDPKSSNYVSYSPYYSNGNNPIYIKDKNGEVQTDPYGNIIYEVVQGSKSKIEIRGIYSVTITPVYVFGNNGKRILVEKYTVVNTQTGLEVSNEVVQQSYNCHGHSTLNNKFRVNSSSYESNQLLLDDAGMSGSGKELKEVVNTDFSQIKTGDVIVLFNSEGVAIHSYVYTGKDATQNQVSSKNGEQPLTEGQGKTKEEIYNMYKDPKDPNDPTKNKDPKDVATSWGFYTPVDNKIVNTLLAPPDVNSSQPPFSKPSNGTVQRNTPTNGGNTGTTTPK